MFLVRIYSGYSIIEPPLSAPQESMAGPGNQALRLATRSSYRLTAWPARVRFLTDKFYFFFLCLAVPHFFFFLLIPPS